MGQASKALAFSVREYQERAAGVQALMAERGLDLMLATTMASVCYLTGIESVSPHKLWLVAVPRVGAPVLLCQDFESYNAKLSSWLEAEFQYGVFQPPGEVLVAMLRKLGMERATIGMEWCNYSSLSTQGYVELVAALPGARLVNATDCVAGVMAIKSPAEIEYLRQAGRMTARAMQLMVDAIAPGTAECMDNDVAAAGYQSLVSQGSEYASYPVIVTTGARSGVPHSTFKRQQILPGHPVFMEIAGCVHRYQTPQMRVAVRGEPTALLKQLAEAAVCSVNTMAEHIRAGAKANDVASKAARCLTHLPERIVWHGYYGYSVGLGFPPEWSDAPGLAIRVGAEDVLRPNMVFHCSTSLRDVGVCGATCSETIRVTENGCEVLTAGLARELFLR